MNDSNKKEVKPSAERSFSATEIVASLARLESWRLSGDGEELAIEKTFHFANFHETMAFVNAVAWIAHTQHHHPELAVSADRCEVRWRTQEVRGITRSDLDCATRIDALLAACTS
jgi:4a-hydroxytetrahydrobiopterin dehydratase